MKKVVHFRATSTLDLTANLALVAAGPCAPLVMSAPARISAVVDVSHPPLVSFASVPSPSAPSHKRNFQGAFGAAGARLSEAPRPAAGSMPVTEWL